MGNSTASFDSNFQSLKPEWMEDNRVLALSGSTIKNILVICGQNFSKIDFAQIGQRWIMVFCSRSMSTVM